MKKSLALFLALALIITCFAACSKTESTNNASGETTNSTEATKSTNTEMKIATLMGPTGMGMAYLFDDYSIDVCASPDEVTSKIVTGEYSIAALPTNVAATLYNKTEGKVKLLALNTGCVLYVLERGNSIKSISDLNGKTVFASGQGSTAEYIFNYCLDGNNVKNVKIDYTYSTHNDLVAYAATGACDIVVLPEPAVTALLAKDKNWRVALSLEDVFEDIDEDNDDVPMGCVVVNTAFAESNPDLVSQFLSDYEKSIEKIDDDDYLAENATAIADAGIVANENIAKTALPRCEIEFEIGDEMKEEVSGFYKILYAANPDSIGGKLPDENFYYKAK